MLNFKQFRYTVPEKVHIVGIRANKEVDNIWSDTLYVFEGNKLLFSGIGTTIPGRPYLLKPMNPKGAAVLKEGQYLNSWTRGKHNGYDALIQYAPITVYRDANRDSIADEKPGTEDRGVFNIDIHHAGQNFIAKFIDNFSAGCQVFQDPTIFAKLMQLVGNSPQTVYTYTLLKEF